MKVSISVIIPTYNRAHYIGECLKSVLPLQQMGAEIIVIDDGSTDNTMGVLSEFGDQINYSKKNNEGKAAAINEILPLIDTEYTLFLDDDDILVPETVINFLEILSNDPDLDVAFGNVIPFLDTPLNPGSSTMRPMPHRNPDSDLFYYLLESNFFHLNSVVFRTRLFEKTGPFNSSLIRSQDYDFLIKLMYLSNWIYVNKTVFYIREHHGIRGSSLIFTEWNNVSKLWSKYDKIIGEMIYSKYSISAFSHSSSKDSPNAVIKRAALFQRSHVMFTKNLQRNAIDDFRLALESYSGDISPLLNCEKQSILGIFESPTLKNYLTSKANRNNLISLINKHNNVAVKKLILKRMYWNLRKIPKIRRLNIYSSQLIFFISLLLSTKSRLQTNIDD